MKKEVKKPSVKSASEVVKSSVGKGKLVTDGADLNKGYKSLGKVMKMPTKK